MFIYHGSNMVVEKPEIISPNRGLDYGKGFYTTDSLTQAKSFATGIIKRRGGVPTLSIYEFDYKKAKTELNICVFEKADEAWLDFVYANRMNKYDGDIYDIIQGPVANDKVYRTLIFYEEGDLNKEQTLAALMATVLDNQTTFCTEKALSYLKFIRSEVLDNG